MNLTTALLLLNLMQAGFSLQRIKACLDALGVDPAEYAGVDLAALRTAFKGDGS